MRSFLFLGLSAVVLLGACGDKPESEAPGVEDASSAPAAEGGVERVGPAAAAQAPAATPAPAIQTQAGPEGSQVSLVRAQVTGDVLTVQLSFQPVDDSYDSYDLDLDQVSVIDDTTSQRYGVLRDAEKRWQASPVPDNNAEVARVIVNNGRPVVAWFKFPAPPATSPTVSINIPEVGPFDGVAVKR